MIATTLRTAPFDPRAPGAARLRLRLVLGAMWLSGDGRLALRPERH